MDGKLIYPEVIVEFSSYTGKELSDSLGQDLTNKGWELGYFNKSTFGTSGWITITG